jgi:Antitoxin Phd_YefM, type II toxin-antitoxin system
MVMPNINTAEDIISLSEFKTHRPVIITQNGRAAGVLLSPAEYDALTYRMNFIAKVEEGLRQADNGELIPDDQFWKEIDEAVLD